VSVAYDTWNPYDPIEDDDDVLRIAQRMVERLGYQVLEKRPG
jgi:hypothetical protein